MEAEKKRELLVLSFPSTELDELVVCDQEGRLTVRLRHEAANALPVEDRLDFDGVRAYRHRAESHCTGWHIDAYDRLVEVIDSEWVEELRKPMSEDLRDLFALHHYMIYIDSYGCYEVVAATWTLVTEAAQGPS